MSILVELAKNKINLLREQSTLMEKSPNVQKLGRYKIIRIRIRHGQVQRKRKVASQRGYTIRQNKVIRMSSLERLHRKRGARIGKIKRRAQLSRILIKRKRSLRKRKSLGL